MDLRSYFSRNCYCLLLKQIGIVKKWEKTGVCSEKLWWSHYGIRAVNASMLTADRAVSNSAFQDNFCPWVNNANLNLCTEFTERKVIVLLNWLSFLRKAEGELSTRAGQRWVELVRVRAGVSISAGDTNNGTEGTLSKLDDTKLEGRDGIQRDLVRHERWECVTLTKSIKAKCKVLQGCSA